MVVADGRTPRELVGKEKVEGDVRGHKSELVSYGDKIT
jgi:hypothetical protein